MSRPSDAEVGRALVDLREIVERSDRPVWGADALAVLREAVKPRELWLSYEVCAALGIPSHALSTDRTPGLPEPAQILSRPNAGNPRNREVRLWAADDIREFKRDVLDPRRKAMRKSATSGGRSDG